MTREERVAHFEGILDRALLAAEQVETARETYEAAKEACEAAQEAYEASKRACEADQSSYGATLDACDAARAAYRASQGACEAAQAACAMAQKAREVKQEAVKDLERYYTGPEWKEDYAADEAGLFPADFKRGVLSQDAVYDLLERWDELSEIPAKELPPRMEGSITIL